MKTLTETIISALEPRAARSRQRTGKIARLPKPTRDRINYLLDEGCEYKAILKDLGLAAKGINHQNLTNWRQGGYQEHLRQQELIERTKAQTEAAAELVHEMADVKVSQILEACDKVAATQLLEVIFERGETALARTLAEQPSKYITVMNVMCNMSNVTLKAEQHRIRMADRQRSLDSNPVPQSNSKEQEATLASNLDLIRAVQTKLGKPNQAFPKWDHTLEADTTSQAAPTVEPASLDRNSLPVYQSRIQNQNSKIPLTQIKPNQASAKLDHLERDCPSRSTPDFAIAADTNHLTEVKPTSASAPQSKIESREVIAKVVRKQREGIPSPGGEGSRMRASLYPEGLIPSFAISSQNPKIRPAPGFHSFNLSEINILPQISRSRTPSSTPAPRLPMSEEHARSRSAAVCGAPAAARPSCMALPASVPMRLPRPPKSSPIKRFPSATVRISDS